MKCWRCGRERDARARHFDVKVCESCLAGHARFAALARRRPHLLELSGPARECVVAWETARLAFTRALLRRGVRVVWRGFEPVVSVVGSAAAEPSSAKLYSLPPGTTPEASQGG